MNGNGRRRGLLRLVLVSWLASSIVGAGCLVYTNRVARQSERKWCALITTIATAQKDAPPTSDPRIATYRKQIAKLRADLGCD